MKQSEIKLGGTYLAKVSDKVVVVRIDRESPHGGWDATNLTTDKQVRIKSAQRLRCPANRDGAAQAKPEVAPAAEAVTTKAAKANPAKRAKAPAKKGKPIKEKKVSALDAAARVLGETGQPMTSREMIEEMSKRGYWSSPNGQTPEATLYAAIIREIGKKGKDSRFAKTERGKFARTKAD